MKEVALFGDSDRYGGEVGNPTFWAAKKKKIPIQDKLFISGHVEIYMQWEHDVFDTQFLVYDRVYNIMYVCFNSLFGNWYFYTRKTSSIL